MTITTALLGSGSDWQANQNSPEIPVNEGIAVSLLLELAVKAKGTSTPPGSPAEGEAHIIGASPTGAWSTFTAKNIAYYHNAAWNELVRQDRLTVFVDNGTGGVTLWRYEAGATNDWNQITLGNSGNLVHSDVTTTISVGYAQTSFNAGTKSSGTFTPDEADGGFQRYVNGGAHTLAPPTNDTSICIQMTNNASAGTITSSGFTIATGDTLTTTDGHDFMFYINKNNGFSHLHVVALQ